MLGRFRGAGGGRLLQRRGVLVVRRLAALLGAVPTLHLLSELLEGEEDLPFASAMVQALNLILLTVPEVCTWPMILSGGGPESICHASASVIWGGSDICLNHDPGAQPHPPSQSQRCAPGPPTTTPHMVRWMRSCFCLYLCHLRRGWPSCPP